MPSLDEIRAAPETVSGSAPADKAAGGPTETPVNEIVESAKLHKEGEAKAAPAETNRTTWIAAGVGVGIGSAALVAALLYANRDKSKKRD